MANEHLKTYLNDHLAGSVAAVELLERLSDEHDGTPLHPFFVELRAEVLADRQELITLMSSLQIDESKVRKVSAWLTEKFTEIKLRVDDPAHGALRLLQALEVLTLGIEGKKLLWRALAAAAEQTDSLRVLNYDRLQERAEEQQRNVEAVRLEAAKESLAEQRARSQKHI